MNRTKLASRLMFAAKQLRGEADRWTGPRREELIRAARQMGWTMRSAYSTHPEDVQAAIALLDAGLDLVASTITERFERELTRGATP